MNHLESTGVFRAFVKNIYWERVHLFLEIDLDFKENISEDIPIEFYGVNALGQARIKFDIIEHSDNHYKITANITNNGQNRCVPIGSYTVFV